MSNTWEPLFPFLRHGHAGPSADQQRAAKRCPVPHSSGGVSAVIRREPGEEAHGRLWDLSRAGACVLLERLAEFSRGELLQLSLTPGLGVDTVNLNAEVCWSEASRRRMYVGLRFHDDPLPFNTFLDCLVKNC